jgi:hypothetical protein
MTDSDNSKTENDLTNGESVKSDSTAENKPKKKPKKNLSEFTGTQGYSPRNFDNTPTTPPPPINYISVLKPLKRDK